MGISAKSPDKASELQSVGQIWCPTVFLDKVLLKHSNTHLFSEGQQSWITVEESTQPAKHKTFTIWPSEGSIKYDKVPNADYCLTPDYISFRIFFVFNFSVENDEFILVFKENVLFFLHRKKDHSQFLIICLKDNTANVKWHSSLLYSI